MSESSKEQFVHYLVQKNHLFNKTGKKRNAPFVRFNLNYNHDKVFVHMYTDQSYGQLTVMKKKTVRGGSAHSFY